MRSRTTWTCRLALALALGTKALSGCRPSSPDSESDSIGTVAPLPSQAQERDLQRSLEGVWSTGTSRGDDVETIYVVEWQDLDGLRIVRDGVWLQGAVEDVDVDNQTLTFRVTGSNGPDETVTLRRVRDAASPEGVRLRAISGQGQAESLGFVRRLTWRDRQELTLEMSQAAVLPPAIVCRGDAAAKRLRATLACSEAEFAQLDRGLRRQLAELSALYPDGERTAAAVVLQLDACTTPDCLRNGYAQWQAYFDENYDLGKLHDYL